MYVLTTCIDSARALVVSPACTCYVSVHTYNSASCYFVLDHLVLSSLKKCRAKSENEVSREQTSQVATSINLKCTIRTKHKIFMVITCMFICINIFTEYAVYDYYRENHPADSPAEYYRRTFAIPLLDCIISELDSSQSVQNCIQSFIPGTHNSG